MPRRSDQIVALMKRRGYVTVTEAASLSGNGERTVRNWLKNKAISGARHGGFVFVSVESLEAFLPQLKDARTA